MTHTFICMDAVFFASAATRSHTASSCIAFSSTRNQLETFFCIFKHHLHDRKIPFSFRISKKTSKRNAKKCHKIRFAFNLSKQAIKKIIIFFIAHGTQIIRSSARSFVSVNFIVNHILFLSVCIICELSLSSESSMFASANAGVYVYVFCCSSSFCNLFLAMRPEK